VTVLHYMIMCYRETLGDAGCPPVPAFGDTLEGCIGLAEQMLLAFHNSPQRTAAQRPLTAHLEDEHGHIAARIRVVDLETTERVAGGAPATSW
jgi:hypothetical protein